jgi:hypothetical protein
MEARELAQTVAASIEAFEIPRKPAPGQLGTQLPPEWFEDRLREMRAALVEPYPLQVFDGHAEPGKTLTKMVAVVADDREGTLLAFDPEPDGDFALVWRSGGENWVSNIRSDAVNCFLSI